MAVLKTENLKKYYGKDAILVRAGRGRPQRRERGIPIDCRNQRFRKVHASAYAGGA